LLGRPAQLLQPAGAGAFLALIVLYKLGDAFAGSLMTPFLLKSMAYSPAEVGVVNKVLGLWLTIAGALAGRRADAQAGPVARAAAVRRAADGQQPGFWWLAVSGKGLAAVPPAGLRLGLRASWPSPRRWTAGC
jgi:PAT family beta-lactamase induction signal transducer AmpG